ncbi:tetratricopeptide repeat protein (plasmid) [Adhaeribacter swui]|uniref:Tetratricopeptide repeat protein n=1 Tax=Adhaeribacter swui TaxID=2086471 RepID=A0A7G7G249_9BACT|nr:tetratricopeptide repeat protein [Adhaeribacter swui]QNF31233.1 tetratricopeptide repeat protein [Adhaeribacter swui]
MKKNYFYTASLVLLVVTGIVLFQKYQNVSEPIPPLRERQGPISTTSEWLNTKAAIQGLQRKLREKPGDLKSKLLLALAYMQEARITGEHPYYYPAALQLVEEILDREPDDQVLVYEATVAKATIQLSLHQFEAALKTGKAALQINNQGAAVYGVLCDANVELGHYEEAIVMADKMASLRPDLKSYSRVSYLREIHGDMPGAIEAMQLAIDAGFPGLEQTAWVTVTLGSLYEKTGDLKNAEAQYNKALAQSSNYAFALGGLGRLAVKQKDYQTAEQIFTQAAGIIPEFSFQEELVRLYQQQNKIIKAKATMEELLEGLEEDQAAGHVVDLELANIHLQLGKDPDKALVYAMKEYKRRPDNIDVCKALAEIYYQKQDYKTAATYLKKATRTSSQDAGLVCLDGLVKFHLGDQINGTHLIQKSLALNPYQNTTLSTEGRNLVSKAISKILFH